MTVQFLEYSLIDGFIHNWLVAGPMTTPVQPAEDESREELARRFFEPQSGVSGMPVDRDHVEIGGVDLIWQYYRCHEDHLVDVSLVSPLLQYLRTWAYTRLNAPSPASVNFHLFTRGPADVWLNGKHIFHKEGFQHGLQPVLFQAALENENELLVRFEQIGDQDTLLQMALRLADLPPNWGEEMQVRVPTRARFPHRHLKFERLLEKAYLDEVANYRGIHINLRWAEDVDEELRYAYQVQDAQERIYVEGTWDINPKEPVDIGHPQRIFERPFWVVLKATPREYYDQNMRYQRRLPIYILDNRYSSQPYGTYPQRRREALEDAARREGNLFAEIAKMGLGNWEKLDSEAIRAAIQQVRQGQTGSETLLTGLLGMLYRYSSEPGFPVELIQLVEESALHFAYEQKVQAESQAILHHTCAILAGQLLPDQFFPPLGKTGQELCRQAKNLALDWLRSRGQSGFLEWDSNCYFERNILALSHLTSLAQDKAVRELAAVLLDKILFLMAVNSFQGAYGCTHGRTCAGMLKSAQLEATSGVMRMLWGVGVFNNHILGTVSLALSTYEFPSFFGEIAAQPANQMWSKEHAIATLQAGTAIPREVNKVVYKTEDYMLSSAQDYYPGEKGKDEHLWQATMGTEAVVFVNHPSCMSDSEAHLPGFWLGNATLPRVAQWKDVLIAVHRLPEDDWMGFTHAYFPIYAFDEYELDGGWAFARKGKGYLAITAKQGIELIKRGPDGYRELRSYGRENIWLCHMGRDSVDGYFRTFKRDILRMRPEWGTLAVRFTSLRKDTLSFGWEGPLMVNGKEQPITGFKHIENPYCTVDIPAKQMDIAYGEVVLRLNFD